jgi:hypothetical protein
MYVKVLQLNVRSYFEYIYNFINNLNNLTKFTKLMIKVDEILDFYISKIYSYMEKKNLIKDSSYNYFKNMTEKANKEIVNDMKDIEDIEDTEDTEIMEEMEDIEGCEEDFNSFIKSQGQNPFNISPPKNPQEMMEQMQQFMSMIEQTNQMMDEIKKHN